MAHSNDSVQMEQLWTNARIATMADGELGLIDEYQLVLHPVALGSGKPFFAGPRPPMHLEASDRIGPKAIRLVYTVAP